VSVILTREADVVVLPEGKASHLTWVNHSVLALNIVKEAEKKKINDQHPEE